MKLIVIVDGIIVYPASLIHNLTKAINSTQNKEIDKVYVICHNKIRADIGDLLVLDVGNNDNTNRIYEFVFHETVYVGKESIGSIDNIELDKYSMVGYDLTNEYMILEHQNSEINWAPTLL